MPITHLPMLLPAFLPAIAFTLAAFLILPGCIPPVPDGPNSPDPYARLDAIIDSADAPDSEALPVLVAQLESLDPLARTLAIRELEHRTGTTLGYDPNGQLWQRSRAVLLWQQRLTNPNGGNNGVPNGEQTQKEHAAQGPHLGTDHDVTPHPTPTPHATNTPTDAP